MKKVLTYVLSMVIVAALAIGGTLAYLQDTDQDVNTMTLGNVKIEQIEQQRGQNGLEDFKDDKPLYPAVFEGSSIPWAEENKWVTPNDQAWKIVEDNVNVVDKFITVTNTGKSNAFVRTLIAFEGDETYGPQGNYIHIVCNGENVNPAINFKYETVIEVNSVKYTVYSFTYPEALAAGETTEPSLKQVYMNKAATNEVVAKYGEKYEILALSQAVQAAGFEDAQTALDTAFGNVTKEKVTEWFENVKVPTTELQ